MARPGSAARRPLISGSSRYELLVRIASGGMASVYVGRRSGSVGFSRLVAIKRAHPHLLRAAGTREMLLREAAAASRIHHPNVVAVRDVEETDDELLLVMDYVEGASLAELLASDDEAQLELPTRIAVRILLDACAGLVAVHALADDAGAPLGLVHRDVSPQNILVGIDGSSRLSDFGLAKVTATTMTRTTGILRGKLAYLPPEYIEGNPFTREGDVFAMGVVLWEALANQRLFRADTQGATIRRVLGEEAPLLSAVVPALGEELDDIAARALEKRPERRWPSVAELALALENVAHRKDLCASRPEVGAFVRERAALALQRRRDLLRACADETEAVLSETISLVHGDLPIGAPDPDSLDGPTQPDADLPDDEKTITRKRPAVSPPPRNQPDDPETLPAEVSLIRRPRGGRPRSVTIAALGALVAGAAFVVWSMARPDAGPAGIPASGPEADPVETAAAQAPVPTPPATQAAAMPTPIAARIEPAASVKTPARVPRTKVAPPPPPAPAPAPAPPPRSTPAPATASPINPTNPYKARLEKL